MIPAQVLQARSLHTHSLSHLIRYQVAPNNHLSVNSLRSQTDIGGDSILDTVPARKGWKSKAPLEEGISKVAYATNLLPLHKLGMHQCFQATAKNA